MAGVGPQFEAGSLGLAHGLQPVLGHADQDFELVGAGDPHDALALRHDLADFGLDGGDDARRVGAQLGVGEVVLGRGELASGLLDLGKRGCGERLALLERLRRERTRAAQIEIALVVCLGARVVGIGGGECCAGIVDGQAKVGRIELGDQVARLDDGADIDGARDDLAGDAEAQGALDAGNDGPGQHERLAALLVGDFHHPGGPGDRLAGRGARRAGRHPGEGAQGHAAAAPTPTDDRHGLQGKLARELNERDTHG